MLLVLALLVSTLLVGRQIIDRAKVQQVISEIDYYTKNFQMFRDQYDFLPGGLGEETCRKYPEFSMQKGDEPTQYPTQCDDPVSMRGGSATKTYTSYQQANFSMVDMVVSGMAENRSPGERIRKKFDIAEQEVETCVPIPAVVNGFYKITANDDWGDICMTYYNEAGGAVSNDIGFHNPNDNSGNIKIEYCPRSSGLNYYHSVYRCSDKISSKNLVFNSCCQNGDEKTYNNMIGSSCGGNYTYSYLGKAGEAYIKLSSRGIEKFKNKMESVCETTTIPGEPRFGYLLKQDEIENQANRASFDSKTWITYSGGKVNYAMIYGVGKDNLFSAAEENSIIVFFHFDPDKGELQDDGAVSYALYDLMIKKLGEKKDQSIGNIIPLNKSAGEGFNFAYIMR